MAIPIAEWPEVPSAEEVAPGNRGLARIPVELGELEGGAQTRLSLFVVRGARPGDTFHLIAGQHGVELNGCAAVEAFINQVDPAQLSGTILAVPVANPVSAARGEANPTYPEGIPHNMNTIWPGKPDGTPIERMAWAIWTHGFSTCEWALDVHSWSRYIPPAALFSTESEALVAFGRATGMRVIQVREAPPVRGPEYTGLATTTARRRGRAIGCAVELSGQCLVYPDQVALGVRVIENVVRHAGLLPGEPEIPRQVNMAAARQVEIRAPEAAIFQPCVRPGDPITAGQPIARLTRFDDLRPQWLTSPIDGVVGYLGSLDQAVDTGRHDRALSSAVRAGERIAVLYEWES